MYELVSENLSGLGGPMGTEETWDNWRKFYDTIDAAKIAAEKDYKGGKKPLKWIKEGSDFRTEDLSYVMYHIHKIKIEGKKS
jgi:hypothetical protein